MKPAEYRKRFFVPIMREVLGPAGFRIVGDHAMYLHGDLQIVLLKETYHPFPGRAQCHFVVRHTFLPTFEVRVPKDGIPRNDQSYPYRFAPSELTPGFSSRAGVRSRSLGARLDEDELMEAILDPPPLDCIRYAATPEVARHELRSARAAELHGQFLTAYEAHLTS